MRCLPNDILASATEASGVPVAALLGPSRAKLYTRVRHAVAHVSREYTGLSFPEIGQHMNRHHSTIMHSIDIAQELMAKDAAFLVMVRRIENGALLRAAGRKDA